MSCKVAFIGLGVMGYPMAGYISKGGHDVTVYNRTKAKAEKWVKEYKGKIADTPMDAAKDCDFIFTCVGNDNDLREVTLGDKGLFKTVKKGAIYVDNTTASANIAREIYEYAKKNGFGSLDAPVSGGQAGAENGALTVMIGGDESPFKKAEPIIDCYSKKIKLLGPSGSGQLTKMVNQIYLQSLFYVYFPFAKIELHLLKLLQSHHAYLILHSFQNLLLQIILVLNLQYKFGLPS